MSWLSIRTFGLGPIATHVGPQTGIWSYQSFLQLPSSYCKVRRLSQWLRRSSPFQRRSNAPPASAQHQDSSCSVESCLHHVVMCPKIRACLTLVVVLWCLLIAWHAIKIPFWVLVGSSRKSTDATMPSPWHLWHLWLMLVLAFHRHDSAHHRNEANTEWSKHRATGRLRSWRMTLTCQGRNMVLILVPGC